MADITAAVPIEETAEPVATQPEASEQELVLDDLIVEDVSIDGMCGVY